MDPNQNQKPNTPSQGASRPTGQAQRYSLERKPDGTLSIKIVVPAREVDTERGKIVDELIKNVEVQGFRKGAAPRNLAIQKLKPELVNEEVLKKVLTDEYVKAVQQLQLKPIVNPRIHVEQFSEGTNLEYIAETCEQPKVELKNYKAEVQKISAQSPKIIVPGQAQKPNQEESNKKLDEILAKILSVTTINIPSVLIEQETNRLLSQLLDELKRLGVSLDQFLSSRGKTTEQLRAEYDDRAERDLKLEFVLRAIADQEKITVDQADVDKALAQIQNPEEKKQIAQNPYLVAAIIRQQKTLDFLAKL